MLKTPPEHTGFTGETIPTVHAGTTILHFTKNGDKIDIYGTTMWGTSMFESTLDLTTLTLSKPSGLTPSNWAKIEASLPPFLVEGKVRKPLRLTARFQGWVVLSRSRRGTSDKLLQFIHYENQGVTLNSEKSNNFSMKLKSGKWTPSNHNKLNAKKMQLINSELNSFLSETDLSGLFVASKKLKSALVATQSTPLTLASMRYLDALTAAETLSVDIFLSRGYAIIQLVDGGEFRLVRLFQDYKAEVEVLEGTIAELERDNPLLDVELFDIMEDMALGMLPPRHGAVPAIKYKGFFVWKRTWRGGAKSVTASPIDPVAVSKLYRSPTSGVRQYTDTSGKARVTASTGTPKIVKDEFIQELEKGTFDDLEEYVSPKSTYTEGAQYLAYGHPLEVVADLGDVVVLKDLLPDSAYLVVKKEGLEVVNSPARYITTLAV